MATVFLKHCISLKLNSNMDYEKHYNLLISKARLRTSISGYVEKHHVVPKCLGGSDDVSNLVALYPEEHYVAHLLLVKMHPNIYAISYSALLMTRGTSQTVRSNKMYGWLKRRFSKDCSEFQRQRFKEKSNHPCYGKFGKEHPRFGKPHSEESKFKIGLAHRGKKMSEDTIRKLSESVKIAFSTEEYKEKISKIRKLAFKGDRNPAYGTKMINNGIVRKRIPKDEKVPKGWNLGAILIKPTEEF